MGLAIAIIALLASLGALWVAAEASKRAEGQQKKFVDAYLINIKQAITDIRLEINVLTKRIEQAESRLTSMAEGKAGETDQMKLELAALKGSLSALAEKLTAGKTPPPQA